MTPEQKQQLRIAIAKALGWKPDEHGYGWLSPNGYYEQVPDYTNCLNAMHEAEKSLRGTDEQYYNDPIVNRRLKEYQYFLMKTYGASATAAQRAEAFCRTLKIGPFAE